MKKIISILAFLMLTICVNSQTTLRLGDQQKLTYNDVTHILTLENGGTVDLSGLVGGAGGTDNQTITNFSISGSNVLSITLEDGNTATVDLSQLAGGVASSTKINAGNNVTITGDGTISTPFVINSSGGGSTTTINNTLISDATNEALSAAKGKDLKGQIDAIVAGSGNPNIIVANTLAEIIAAGTGATVEIRSVIALTSNLTLPENQTWLFTTGAIDFSTFNLGFNKLHVLAFQDDYKKYFYGTTGVFSGEIKIPNRYTALNFGLNNEGEEFFYAVSSTADSDVITVTGGTFEAKNVGDFFAIKGANSDFSDVTNGQKSLNTSIIEAISATSVRIAENATRTATNMMGITGYDNLNNFKNLTFVFGQNGGNLIFTKGTYYLSTSINDSSSGINHVNNAPTFEMADDAKISAFGAIIAAIPNKLPQSNLLKFRNMHRFVWEGGRIKGEMDYHNHSGLYTPQGDGVNVDVLIGTAMYDAEFRNVNMGKTSGTTMSTAGDLAFTNYIKGDLAANIVQRVTDMTYGTIDEATGVVTVDPLAEFAYTTTLIDISTTVFENTRIANPDRTGERHYSFAGSSFAGWGGLQTRVFWAYYYDENQVFLRKTNFMSAYTITKYWDDVKYVRILVERPTNLDVIDMQVRAPLNPVGLVLNNVNISGAYAHNLSNMPSEFLMKGGSLLDVRSVVPAFSSNTEDMRAAARNQTFDGVTFAEAYTGYLNFVGTTGVKVINCKFLQTSDVRNIRGSTKPMALLLNQARDAIATNNTYEGSTISAGRSSQIHGELMKYGEVHLTGNGEDVYNMEMYNSSVRGVDAGVNTTRELGRFRNSFLSFDRSFGGAIFRDENYIIAYENTNILFNEKARTTYLNTKDVEFKKFYFGENSNKLFNQSPISTRDMGGYIKNWNLEGGQFVAAARDYSGATYPCINMTGFINSSVPMNIKKGAPTSKEFHNLKTPFLILSLSDYENTVVSATPTITLFNPVFNVNSDEFVWTNTNAFVFRTHKKNVNVDIIGGEFNLNVASGVTGASNRFIKMDHWGWTRFNGSKFHSETAKTINFTSAFVLNQAAGPITLIDVETDGITFVLRSIDKMLYTKTHVDMPVYADNAAAIASGYVVGYMYRTATGDMKITF